MNAYLLPEPTPLERRIAKIVSGSAAQTAAWKTFPDGEIFCRVSTVTEDACVIGRTLPPAENFFRTALLVDTLRRDGAKNITAVVPYMAYSRQDRPMAPGEPVTAQFLLAALAAAGATRFVTVDLHSQRTAEASPIPVLNVNPLPEMAAAVRLGFSGDEFTVIAPDDGAKPRAEYFAGLLNARQPAWIEKRRDPKTGKLKFAGVHGDLRGGIAIIVDDMVDTGGTLTLAIDALRKKGFTRFRLCATHPVFTHGAKAVIEKLGLEQVVTTNTIAHAESHGSQVHVVDISGLVADAIASEK